jgi:hypothetical protein
MPQLIDDQGNGLGYEYELEDNDLLEEFSSPWDGLYEFSDAPPEIDYGQGLAIRNQASRPSCRGHSLAAAARMVARVANRGNIDLNENGVAGEPIVDDFSPLWAWVRTQVHGGTVGPNRGATMGGGIKAGLQDGMAREVVWPYSKPHTTRIPQEVVTDAARFRMARYSTLRTEQDVFRWFASGQGVVESGTGWPLSWIGGSLADSGGMGAGGHATCGRGYWTGKRVADTVPAIASRVRNEPYVYVWENSHGTGAQFRGLFFITRRGMEAILRARHSHFIGWSDMAWARPRKFDWDNIKVV